MPKKGAMSEASFSSGRTDTNTSRSKYQGKRQPSKPSKIVYHGDEAIARGKCGYEGCARALRRPDDDDDDDVVLECDQHFETATRCYGYQPRLKTMTRYNTEGNFQESVNNAHVHVHSTNTDIEKGVRRGSRPQGRGELH